MSLMCLTFAVSISPFGYTLTPKLVLFCSLWAIFFDLMILYSSRFEVMFPTLGTSLTEDQINKFSHLHEVRFFCFVNIDVEVVWFNWWAIVMCHCQLSIFDIWKEEWFLLTTLACLVNQSASSMLTFFFGIVILFNIIWKAFVRANRKFCLSCPAISTVIFLWMPYLCEVRHPIMGIHSTYQTISCGFYLHFTYQAFISIFVCYPFIFFLLMLPCWTELLNHSVSLVLLIFDMNTIYFYKMSPIGHVSLHSINYYWKINDAGKWLFFIKCKKSKI